MILRVRPGLALAALLFGLLSGLLTACSQSPPSWDSLLAGKITGQYPTYSVTVAAPGQLHVERPGMPDKVIAVDPIAQHCLRGARDCSYAVEQMLLELRDP
ncbi:hypothetical protein [Polaromonas sp. YR568]|uniref:hypothetical protein n=1 Tax=Polaromonas sp. YR568 TaxID=1855301 RepID=UPI003137BB44